MNSFAGMKVIYSEFLTQPGEPYEARRSWRERLLTRPWRPLQATRTVTPQVPYKGAFQLDRNTLVMHPQTARLLTSASPETQDTP